MKLVVGLGNPGRQYQATRHNVGFEVLAELGRRAGGGRPKAAFRGEVLDVSLSGERWVLLAPQTFMNRSGTSVVLARDFYKLENEQILVVCDDFALPVGKIRLRGQGSSGGQKGLDDTIRCLGTDEVARLRVGIGPVPEGRDAADFVLGRFTADEKSMMTEVVARSADAVISWGTAGVATTMNKYN